jgi:hypothetical protein
MTTIDAIAATEAALKVKQATAITALVSNPSSHIKISPGASSSTFVRRALPDFKPPLPTGHPPMAPAMATQDGAGFKTPHQAACSRARQRQPSLMLAACPERVPPPPTDFLSWLVLLRNAL